MWNDRLQLGHVNIGVVVTHLFNFAKALLHLSIHSNSLSFVSMANNGKVILEKKNV